MSTNIEPGSARGRGRPRDGEADRAILEAAAELLVGGGYDEFSLDRVATRAGVARTTVYRRYPTRSHLVVAVMAGLQREAPLPDTGDVRRDLLELMRSMVSVLDRPSMRRLAGELVAAAARDAGVGEAARKLWVGRRQAAFALLLRAGWRDPSVLVDQLAGPIYYRALITGDPIDDEYLRRLIAAVLPGEGPIDEGA
ncbi:MAG TPA: TetR/AcrR family transcriptional regulator [Candidatus Dormibacteraeota bacterium]|nr:TetR/AcrR family transcriptional regulator [Candidatus Dormibacteraeota bacterium]